MRKWARPYLDGILNSRTGKEGEEDRKKGPYSTRERIGSSLALLYDRELANWVTYARRAPWIPKSDAVSGFPISPGIFLRNFERVWSKNWSPLNIDDWMKGKGASSLESSVICVI